MSVRLLTGDCRDVLKTLPDASVDSIVTDPPYHLTQASRGGHARTNNPATPHGRTRIGDKGFMGKVWDGGDIAFQVEMWAECLRVLKPGGHLLAFSGTRTQHRMVCAIEDAGFEIRDQAGWMYGSGFPKNLDVSKAIDKAAGATRTEVVGVKLGHEGFIDRVDAHAAGTRVAGWDRPWKDDPAAVRASHMNLAPATDAAKQWEGWGTALKPAWEPICVARKPLVGTVAANVLEHGTGALNIDACRIEVTDESYARNASGDRGHAGTRDGEDSGATDIRAGGGAAHATGRWPANLLHDGSAEVIALFPESNGQQGDLQGQSRGRKGNVYAEMNPAPDAPDAPARGDSGTAARFFWCPKTSANDRHEGLEHPGAQFSMGRTPRDAEKVNAAGKGNHHPTVKPTELMRYLCRLVTPPGGTVLDPFAGSGSTLKAAELEGFSAIGIELDPDYVAIAQRRIAADAPLFAEVVA